MPFVVLATVCIVSSCIWETGAEDVADGPALIGMSLRVRSAGSAPGYADGGAAENRVDIAGGDYRIYFFTNDPSSDSAGQPDRLSEGESSASGGGVFIARFIPKDLNVSGNGGSYTNYFLRGEVPAGLLDRADFKVVVIANWGEDNYPDDLVSGKTTLEELCNPPADAGWGIFSIGSLGTPSATDGDAAEGGLMPFYGVQDYEGVEFSEGDATVLSAPICLLRAAAKVEVRLTNDNLVISEARLCRYNEAGYCAPAGVYDGSYVHSDGSWSVGGIHLIGGANDPGQDGRENPVEPDSRSPRSAEASEGVRTMTLYNTVTAEDADPATGVYQTWAAYVPEYYNGGDDYSYLEVLFENQEELLETAEPFRIYFAEYDPDTGKLPEDSSYYDIARNTFYRFNVTYDTAFRVEPQRWEDEVDNDFIL